MVYGISHFTATRRSRSRRGPTQRMKQTKAWSAKARCNIWPNRELTGAVSFPAPTGTAAFSTVMVCYGYRDDGRHSAGSRDEMVAGAAGSGVT